VISVQTNGLDLGRVRQTRMYIPSAVPWRTPIHMIKNKPPSFGTHQWTHEATFTSRKCYVL